MTRTALALLVLILAGCASGGAGDSTYSVRVGDRNDPAPQAGGGGGM